MELKSSAFYAHGEIPRKYSREGEDASPPLTWSGAPQNARAFALICEDPDAPRPEPWVHWVVANIPAETHEIREGGVDGGVEGRNDFGENGYGGPLPPPGHGRHHYHFKLYALDAPLEIKPGIQKAELQKAMEGHVVDVAELVGTYERPA